MTLNAVINLTTIWKTNVGCSLFLINNIVTILLLQYANDCTQIAFVIGRYVVYILDYIQLRRDLKEKHEPYGIYVLYIFYTHCFAFNLHM